MNKYLRLAVLEKNRGVVQGLEASDALGDIRATVRESETRNALALESALADLRAEQSAALQANEELVVKTLQAFSQFLAQQEPDAETLQATGCRTQSSFCCYLGVPAQNSNPSPLPHKEAYP